MTGGSGGAKLSRHYRRLVGTAKQLAKAGIQKEPKWLRALERCPPLPLEVQKKPKPKNIVFPEDRFIQGFYDRHPEARQLPLDLSSESAPPAKRFALRQLQLVRQGHSPLAAREKVTAEFEQAGLLAVTGSKGPGTVVLLQQEEEEMLRNAMLETSFSRS